MPMCRVIPLDGQPMQLVDGGEAYRTITYIDDAVDALTAMLDTKKARNTFFNIGNRANEVKVRELAHLMRDVYAEITGDESYKSHPIEEVSGEKFYGPGYEDCDRRVPDVSRAERLLGWPKVRKELHAVGIDGPTELMAIYQFSGTDILDFAGHAELNTDDNMRIEYSAPMHLHADTQDENFRLLIHNAQVPRQALPPDPDAWMELARTYRDRDDIPRGVGAMAGAIGGGSAMDGVGTRRGPNYVPGGASPVAFMSPGRPSIVPASPSRRSARSLG